MIATTRAALIRDVIAQDDAGDDESTIGVVEGFESFPASIIERARRVWDPSSNEARVVREVTVRLSGRIPVQSSDRIKDLRTGTIYSIDGDFTRTPRSISGRSSVTLKVKTTAP